MHPLFQQAASLTEEIIGAAIEVHRDKGPGLIESIYEWCLTKELGLRNLSCVNQKAVEITYKAFVKNEDLRFDILVEDCVIIEVKSVAKTLPIQGTSGNTVFDDAGSIRQNMTVFLDIVIFPRRL